MIISNLNKIFLYLRVASWSRVKQLVICLLLSGLIIILGYGSDIKGLQKKLKSMRTQVATTKLLIRNKKQPIQQTKLIFKEPNKILGTIDVLTNLDKALAEAQVTASLFEPQITRESEWLTVYPVKLEISGGYQNLLKFINNVLKQPYLTMVEDIAIQKNGEDEGLNMRVLLAVYQEKKRVTYLIDQATASIQLAKRDIFKKSDIEINLFLWSSKELVFLGIIKRGGKTFGVISDPQGNVHKVTVGDRLGLGQSKIITIDDGGVMVANAMDNVMRRD